MGQHKHKATNLPPAGDERRDELKRRADQLAEQAENTEAFAINPAAFEVDNEIASRFNELDVSNAQEGFVYRWVWTGQNNLMVRRAMAERYPGYQGGGWQIVSGDMPEAKEARDGVTGAARVGDAILLRAPLGFALARHRHQIRLNALHRGSVTASLKDMAARYANKGLQIHISDEDLESPVMKQVMKRMLAREIAGQKVTGMLRTGTIPGMEV